MAMNPPIRYIVDGESPNQSVLNRPILDLISNLQRIDSLRINLFSSIPADAVVSGRFHQARIPYATETNHGGVLLARDQDIDTTVENTRYVAPKHLRELSAGIATQGGVSLDGPLIVVAGSTGTYQITNFDSFSSYTVEIDDEDSSVSLTGDEIELDVDLSSTGQILMVVEKNNVPYTFAVSIGTPSVNRPTLTNSFANFIPTGTLVSSSFSTTPSGSDTHLNTDWQIASNSSFSSIVTQSMADSVNLTNWTVPNGMLTLGATYYARVRHRSSTIGASAWSPTKSFTVVNRPNTPSITSPVDDAVDIGETPTIIASAFVSPISESHQASDWQVRRVSNNSVVHNVVLSTSDKTSMTIPAGKLLENTEYRVRVRYYGSTLGYSDWSAYVNFTTQTEFFDFSPASAGLPFGGGFYAGANIIIDGLKYAIIVAPRSSGEIQGVFRTGGQPLSNSTTPNDGYENTYDYFSPNSGLVEWARTRTIGGYSDWYIPSMAELEICYRFWHTSAALGGLSNATGTGAFRSYVNPYSDPVGYAYTSSNPGRFNRSPNDFRARTNTLVNSVWDTAVHYSGGRWWGVLDDFYVTEIPYYACSTTTSTNVYYFAFTDGTRVNNTGMNDIVTTESDAMYTYGSGESESQPFVYNYQFTTTNTRYYARVVRRHLIGPA